MSRHFVTTRLECNLSIVCVFVVGLSHLIYHIPPLCVWMPDMFKDVVYACMYVYTCVYVDLCLFIVKAPSAMCEAVVCFLAW